MPTRNGQTGSWLGIRLLIGTVIGGHIQKFIFQGTEAEIKRPVGEAASKAG